MDASGKLSFKYPVEEYINEESVASNSKGVLKFSHISKGLEFGGSCHSIGLAEWGVCFSPEFKLIFKSEKKEIYRINYTSLSELGEKVSINKVIY